MRKKNCSIPPYTSYLKSNLSLDGIARCVANIFYKSKYTAQQKYAELNSGVKLLNYDIVKFRKTFQTFKQTP